MLTRGSEWHRWDLQIHSPVSGLNNQFPKLENGEPDWDAYITALEGLSAVPVIGVTDYFSIEGYKKVCEYKRKGRLSNISLILPNIEFRLDKIIDVSGEKRRLNYHVLFSDSVTPEQIEEHFLQEIKFAFDGDPQRTDLSLSIRRENLTLLGQRLKQEHASFRNRSDYEIGCTCATVSPNDIKDILTSKESLFKGQYLILLPDEHLSVLDWDSQDHLVRKNLLRGADAILSANAKTMRWASGQGDLSEDAFKKEFKSLKPCVHGSDAHRIESIGAPNGNKYCWIKSDLTFEGLKQILYEAIDRVFIGESPANLKNDYQVIESATIENALDWFEAVSVPLNTDLISIIGPRGSGKSALAEAIAFAGGAGTFRTPNGLRDSFLYKAAKRSAANPNPVVGAQITLRWRNGDVDTATIPASLTNEGREEKIKYLPQKFVEWLCAPENTQELEAEIEKVIYQRNKKVERLNASNFQELRKATTQPIETKREHLVRTIQTLNAAIADAAAHSMLRPQKEIDLKRRQDELKRLVKAPPTMPAENKEELNRLEALEKERQQLELRLAGLTEQLTAIDTIQAKFDVLAQDLESFNKDVAELMQKAGLVDASELTVSVPNFAKPIVARRNAISAEMGALRGTKDAESDPSGRTLTAVLSEIDALREKSKLTESKRKEYEKFQQDKQKLDELIASTTKEIAEIDTVVRPKIRADQDERLERYLDAFDLLKEERLVLETLYQPLKEALEKSNETAKKLTFVARTTFDTAQHAARGIELFDRRKSVFSDPDSLEQELSGFFEAIQQNDFDRNSVRNAAKDLLAKFEPSKLREQLRSGYSQKDFADWFFYVGSYSTTYGIKFDNKDLRFLSPGEKGIVLLLLYLEAEEGDNRPLIIDQPDDNLDNLSVYPNLIEYFRSRKKTRQIIIITHNPNLVVTTDSEQVVVASFDGTRTPKIGYRAGSLEDTHPEPALGIREEVCRILEGGTKAFQLREARYAL
jgi:energy-coupling factor transporter ATP-binding protein EcfA2